MFACCGPPPIDVTREGVRRVERLLELPAKIAQRAGFRRVVIQPVLHHNQLNAPALDRRPKHEEACVIQRPISLSME